MKEIVYDKNTNENSDIQKHIYGFEFTSRDNMNIPLVDFLDSANKSVSKFILLTSFLSGEQYDWFYSYEISSDKYKYTYKSFENKNTQRIGRSQLLISPNEFLTFIEKAIVYYNEALNNNIDLYISLIYYLTHDKPIFIEQQFIVLYIALENICYQLSYYMKLTENADSKLFKKLSSRIKAVIDEFDLNQESKENILKKISELKRSPIKFRFERIFDKYQIDISDCYRDEKKEVINFLSIRNKLMHTNYTGNSTTVEEYYRIKKYYELLMLKLLGWEKGITNSYYLFRKYNLDK